jgi:hypothetical protein
MTVNLIFKEARRLRRAARLGKGGRRAVNLLR